MEEYVNVHNVNTEWIIVDGIGAFFEGYDKRRINWSKIPLAELPVSGAKADKYWSVVRENMRKFVERVKRVGYNTVTLDDVAHVVPLDEYDDALLARVQRLRDEMKRVIEIIKQAGMRVLMSTDVIPMSANIEKKLHGHRQEMLDYFADLLERFMDDFSEVDGVVMRLGEGDGNDVKGDILNELFVKTTKEGNLLLKRILPSFEERGKVLICRTWTVGAYSIGDLIWNQRRIAQFLKGIESEQFILSMKYGDSDFFRYLETNEAFFQHEVKKIVEFQARREYEGAGEYPNFIGFDAEKTLSEMAEVYHLVGVSVWVQTGGWHAFRRLSYIGNASPWVEMNSEVIVLMFQKQITAREAITNIVGEGDAEQAVRFFELADRVVREGLYVREFAENAWYFRRVRIPPLLHVYWDCVFLYHPVKRVMAHFVRDGEKAIREAQKVLECFPEMLELAERMNWEHSRIDDIVFMRDTFEVFAVAREYYFGKFDEAMKTRLLEMKTQYKKKYPRSVRRRFRIKADFRRFPVGKKKLAIFRQVLTRKKSRYRLVDQIITLRLLGVVYRFFTKRNKKLMPKFLRKSAMGVDSLFE